MFEGGELRLVILLLTESDPRHGYDLIRDVEARASEDAKRLYAITPAGRAHLAENRATAEAALARLDQLRRKGEVFDAGPVFRAMTNLKAVLQQRLVDPNDKQLMFSVADLIDEAARKIERL
jgi:DNA-binding PadR family transcriptional regulator